MTNEEKLDFVLDYLKISASEVAEKFETSKSVVSQWRSTNYKKFKKMHQYALKDAFGIPLEVFEDSITKKEEIVSLLNKTMYQDNSNIDYEILEKLIGDRYCYSYNSSDLLKIDFLRFLDDLTVLCYEDDNLQFYGKVIFLDKAQTIISLSSKEYPYNIFIIFDTEYIVNDIFYATLMFKSDYIKQDVVEFIIISKKKLPLNDIKKLLQNPQSKRLKANKEFIENIQYYQAHQCFFNSDIIDFLEGSWNLYFKIGTIKRHKIVISDNYRAFWYADNELSSKGYLEFDQSNTIIEFKNRVGDKSYFIFDNQKVDIKVFAFKSYIYATKEEIVGVGIMSKKNLDISLLHQIFSFREKFDFNINRFKSFLEDLKNDFLNKEESINILDKKIYHNFTVKELL